VNLSHYSIDFNARESCRRTAYKGGVLQHRGRTAENVRFPSTRKGVSNEPTRQSDAVSARGNAGTILALDTVSPALAKTALRRQRLLSWSAQLHPVKHFTVALA